MKTVGLVTDPSYVMHDTGNHPERPDRLRKTLSVLRENDIAGDSRQAHFVELTPRLATVEELKWCHSAPLIDRVSKIIARTKKTHQLSNLDGDTVVCEDSWNAAMLAAGGNFTAIDAIFNGDVDRSFALCRPPGHHSNRDYSRGFCIFNNIALAAEYLFREKKLKKVAILDFDVHAGNGTEEIFESGTESGDLLMISLHQHPHSLYPGTCFMDDIGTGKMEGKICNVTFSPGAGHGSVQLAMNELIKPMLSEFGAEFLLISAGFDAHYADPLANLGYVDQTYTYYIQQLREIVPKIACTLEGGYNLDAISRSITYVMRALAEDSPIFEDQEYRESEKALKHTQEKLLPELKRTLSPYWAAF